MFDVKALRTPFYSLYVYVYLFLVNVKNLTCLSDGRVLTR